VDSGSTSPNLVVPRARRCPTAANSRCPSEERSIVASRDSTRYSVTGSDARPVLLRSEGSNQVRLIEEVVLEEGRNLSLPAAT